MCSQVAFATTTPATLGARCLCQRRLRGIDAPDWGSSAAAQLERDVKKRCQGTEDLQNLGMELKDAKGERVHVDDPRIDPVWRKAGELGIPS